jgi:hypothetical protein
MLAGKATLPHRGIVFIENGHQYGITAPWEPRVIYNLLTNLFKKILLINKYPCKFTRNTPASLRGSHGAGAVNKRILSYKHRAPLELSLITLPPQAVSINKF